jgi:hypothetical protein
MIRLVVWVLAAFAVPLPALALACGDGSQDELLRTTEEGELVTSSGKLIKLAGVRLPEDPVLRAQAVAAVNQQCGPARLESLGGEDRWGRRSAVVATTHGTDLATDLVSRGLALRDGPDVPCAPGLAAAEQTARAGGLGVWSQDRYKPIDAMQIDRLREEAGRFVLVEGQVRSVGERAQWTYLNFGGKWAEDFTVVVPKAVWTHLRERGMQASSLKGSRVRVRGIVEEWQGAAITITAPGMIERVEGSRFLSGRP